VLPRLVGFVVFLEERDDSMCVRTHESDGDRVVVVRDSLATVKRVS